MTAVTVERKGAVLHAVMDVPPSNPLGEVLIAGLVSAIEEFEGTDAKVLVISSASSRIFAAGADITLMAELDGSGMQRYIEAVRAPLWRLASCGKVTIAAIDGHCLGGGLELAIACTLRLAASSAKLGLPEVKLGLIPGAGGTQRLPRLVGRGRALELTLSGRSISASEAHAIGLVDRVTDGSITDFALEYAADLASFPRSALQALLRCADAADGVTADGFDVEKSEIMRMMVEGEGPEGLRAFLEKRPPVYG